MRQGRLRFALVAGLADQATSSLVGLILTIVTGRALGAGGLGSVAVGLTLYLAMAGFHRALVLEPLGVQAAEEDHTDAPRAALTVALAGGAAGTAVMYALSLALGGSVGEAVAGFAPWITAALLVETARAAAFREGRITVGITGHAVWLVVMGVRLVAAGELDVSTAAGAWGAGAAAGAAVACVRLHHLPARFGAAWAWWRTAWPLGRWLALQTAVYTAGINGAQFGVAVVAGPAALGTLRAVQTLFAPLTLLLPAFNVSALPVVARTFKASASAARSLALRLTVFLCGACGAYLVVALAARGRLTELAFGSALQLPAAVMWPVALGQIVVAASLGSFLLLKAAEDGRGVFAATAVHAGVTFAAAIPLAFFHGAAGAAWGIAFGGAAATAFVLARPASGVKDAPPSRVRVRMAPTR